MSLFRRPGHVFGGQRLSDLQFNSTLKDGWINKPFGEHIIIFKNPVGQGRFFVRFRVWPAAHGWIFVGESSWVRKKQLWCLRFWATGRPRDNITIRFREAPVILSVFSWIQGNFPCFYTHQSPGVLRDIAIFSWTTCEHSIFRKHRHLTTQNYVFVVVHYHSS